MAYGQRTLIQIDGKNTFEIGGQFTRTSDLNLGGLWMAYNGPVRFEVTANKVLDQFDLLTEFTGWLTVPLLKQKQSFPLFVNLDGVYSTVATGGENLSAIYGGGVIGHQIKSNSSVISPYIAAGYNKPDGFDGSLRYGGGIDFQFSKVVLGIEYATEELGNVLSVKLGVKIGGNGERASEKQAFEDMEDEADKLAAMEKADMERLQKEMEEVEQLNKELEEKRLADLRSEKEAIEAEKERKAKEMEEKTATGDQNSDTAVANTSPSDTLSNSNNTSASNAANTAKEQPLSNEEKLAQLKNAVDNLGKNTDPSNLGQVDETEIANTPKSESNSSNTTSNSPSASTTVEPNSSGNITVQFFASKSGTKNFSELGDLGQIIVDYVADKDLYRYKVGYFSSRSEADAVIRALSSRGFPGAYVHIN